MKPFPPVALIQSACVVATKARSDGYGVFRRVLSLALLSLVAHAEPARDFRSEVYPVFEKHCFKCHGPEKQKSDVRLDNLSTDLLKDRRAAETWREVLNVLNLGDMPPDDEPPLADHDRRSLIGWLSVEVARAIQAQRQTGSGVVLRRLNRIEYNNTMGDLLGIADDYARDQPPDSVSPDGFKNNGAILGITDMQLEFYLQAARDALALVIVTEAEPEVFRERFTEPFKDKGYGPWSDTLGRTGLFVASMNKYPKRGEFIVRVKAHAIPHENMGYPQLSVCVGYRADVAAPFREMGRTDVTSTETQTFEYRGRMEQFPQSVRLQKKYSGLKIWLRNVYNDGTHPESTEPFRVLTAQTILPVRIKDPDEYLTFPQVVVESVEFEGPIFDRWPPVQHRSIVFDSELRAGDESAYAHEVITRFMARAFRRPVTTDEVKNYFTYYQKIRTQSDSLESAMREALAMVLVSPDFLFLVEAASPQGRRPLNDYELAARLSYFLHATMPDAELRGLADGGKLTDPGELRSQVKRLLNDDRSWRFVEQFTDQWLDLGAVDRVAINPEFYPNFDNSLKADMRRETQHFFAELLHRDLSALNLIDSDFTMLNEPLARLYGIPGPQGNQFEQVALKPTDHRGGVLAQGAFLLGNSTGNDSHAIKRAVWIRKRLLNDPPAPPPPNVPVLDAESPHFARLPIRQQMELHRKDLACADCHRNIDPWGIPLEEFGADGRWREQILRKEKVGDRLEDIRIDVEADAVMPGGAKLSGSEDLKQYLLEHKHKQFARALTSKLLAYALGRSLELGDETTVDDLTKDFAKTNYNLGKLIEEIVVSEPFLTK